MRYAVCLGASLLFASACIPDAGEDWTPPDAADETPRSDGGSDASGATEIYVYAEGFSFSFTPSGADPSTLTVPANSKVHFRLAQAPSEETHYVSITIAGFTTPAIKLGIKGAETEYTWTSPKAGTYAKGGYCTVHKGMDFDVVVTP